MAAKPTPRCDKGPVALIDRAVVHEGAPILFVFHEDDEPSGWSFLKQHMDNPGYADDLILECVHCVFERHPELAAVRDLPDGHWAFRRSTEHAWTRGAFDEDDE